MTTELPLGHEYREGIHKPDDSLRCWKRVDGVGGWHYCGQPASAHVAMGEGQAGWQHCDECDPAFSCFDGPYLCRKKPSAPAQPPRQEEQPDQYNQKPHAFKPGGVDGYCDAESVKGHVWACGLPESHSLHHLPAPPAQDGAAEHIVEMYLCEIPWLILKPQAYRFSAHPDCEKCAEYQNPKGAPTEPPQAREHLRMGRAQV